MDFQPAEHPAPALRHSGIDPALAADSLLIAEIAGRDSVAAAVASTRARGTRTVLPTAVHTSTEYGDEDAPERAADRLRDLLAAEGVDVLPLVHLGSPALWAALNGRYARVIASTFGSHSPCLACHLYMHLCRVPLSWHLGSAPVVAGERDSHDGKVKLSQLPMGIDASVRVFDHAGIELDEPLRHASSATVESLVGGSWPAGDGQLSCVHSGNYIGLDGTVAFDELAYARYVHAFLEPAGVAIVDAWRSADEPGYSAIVAGVLAGPGAA